MFARKEGLGARVGAAQRLITVRAIDAEMRVYTYVGAASELVDVDEPFSACCTEKGRPDRIATPTSLDPPSLCYAVG